MTLSVRAFLSLSHSFSLEHTVRTRTDTLAYTRSSDIFNIIHTHGKKERESWWAHRGATIHFSNESWFVAPINTVNAFSSCLFNVRTTMRGAQSRDEKNWLGRSLASRLRFPVYLYYIYIFVTRFQRKISSFIYILFLFSFRVRFG